VIMRAGAAGLTNPAGRLGVSVGCVGPGVVRGWCAAYSMLVYRVGRLSIGDGKTAFSILILGRAGMYLSGVVWWQIGHASWISSYHHNGTFPSLSSIFSFWSLRKELQCSPIQPRILHVHQVPAVTATTVAGIVSLRYCMMASIQRTVH
jgi:hypothetical protein